jgi:transposase
MNRQIGSRPLKENLFWLNDRQWMRIKPIIPSNRAGAKPRILSGVNYVPTDGFRWQNCPPEYGPYAVLSNRFNRWGKRETFRQICEAVAGSRARRSRAGQHADQSAPRRRRRKGVTGNRRLVSCAVATTASFMHFLTRTAARGLKLSGLCSTPVERAINLHPISRSPAFFSSRPGISNGKSLTGGPRYTAATSSVLILDRRNVM